LFILFFVSIALAAIAGGTVHGFFLNEDSFGHRLLWPFTLVCLGGTALAGLLIGTNLVYSPARGHWINAVGYAAFSAYTIVVVLLRRDFRIAVLSYIPSLIFLAVVFVMVYARSGQRDLLAGLLGVCTMFLAAVAQQAKWGIHPRLFNHNAVYHVLQALSLWMIFIAARQTIRLGE
jgi:hypothetical protein